MGGNSLAPNRPFVLELAGLAGAGKSTLSTALTRHEHPLCTGLSVYGLPRWRLALNAVRLLPSCVAPSGYRCLGDERMKQVVRLKTLSQILALQFSKPWRAIVLDEGPVFTLGWLDLFGGPKAMGQKGFQTWWRSALQKWSSTLDAIVWLDAPDSLLTGRIRHRVNGHPFKVKTDREILEFLARFRASYERVLSELTASDGPKVIRFATDRDSTEQIADRLHEMVTAEKECRDPA